MELKQLRISKRALVLLLVSILLCTNVALSSTVDVKVTRGGNPVPGIQVYIDGNPVETTSGNGQISANVSPGSHTAMAEGISRPFDVQPDGYVWLEIQLPP